MGDAVVPGYYLVCYNKITFPYANGSAVVPGYYLVCYNRQQYKRLDRKL